MDRIELPVRAETPTASYQVISEGAHTWAEIHLNGAHVASTLRLARGHVSRSAWSAIELCREIGK